MSFSFCYTLLSVFHYYSPFDFITILGTFGSLFVFNRTFPLLLFVLPSFFLPLHSFSWFVFCPLPTSFLSFCFSFLLFPFFVSLLFAVQHFFLLFFLHFFSFQSSSLPSPSILPPFLPTPSHPCLFLPFPLTLMPSILPYFLSIFTLNFLSLLSPLTSPVRPHFPKSRPIEFLGRDGRRNTLDA